VTSLGRLGISRDLVYDLLRRGELVAAGLVVAAAALALSAIALTIALRHSPGGYPLVCRQQFTNASGRVSPVWYPCQEGARP
jgi:hypothetical protein